MIMRIDRRQVDVARADCGSRLCFQLGFDKGSFTAGRGYTSYHRNINGRRIERAVCMTRHLHGCPHASVCPVCRLVEIDPPGARCSHGCGATVAV